MKLPALQLCPMHSPTTGHRKSSMTRKASSTICSTLLTGTIRALHLLCISLVTLRYRNLRQVLSCSITSILAAYAFVFFDFKGKRGVYFLLISTMFIPFTVTMIPNYITISQMGLNDNIMGVALPQFADALGIFLLRQSMRTIPRSLVEVAKIEKIGHARVMKDIIVPIIKPSVVSTGIIFFINSWNEYVWPVLILKSKDNYTLSLALQMFISAEGGTDFTVAMAVSVITMMVPLLMYIIFQRYIINTFALSGVK